MTVKGLTGFFLLMLTSLAHAQPTDIQIKANIPADNPCPGNLVVILNFTRIAAQLNVELADPNLVASQIKMVVSTKKTKGKPSVVVRVSDPLAKLFYFEIVDASGNEWDAVADTTTVGSTTTYTYPGSLPEDASLRVCVPTPKAILTMPLSLKDIALPQKNGLVSNLEAGKKQTVVTYGTSLTAGGAWVGQLSTDLKRRYPGLSAVINSGGSGMCSKWGVDNLNTRVISKQPDTVFIEFSINDAFSKYKVSVPQARSNLLNMVDRVLAANKACEIILMVMNPPIGVHLTSRPNIESYNQMARDVATERGLMLIDHYPDWQKILKADPKQFSALVPDGIHPNAEGCKQIILPNILRALGVKTEPKPALSSSTAGAKQ